MRNRLVTILSILLIFLLAGCSAADAVAASASPTATQSSPEDVTAAEIATEPAPNEEVARAIDLGLVPLSLQSAYDKVITYAEYCSMLQSMISLIDNSAVAKWQEVAATALGSDQSMRREDAMLSIYEAACVLGKGAEPNGDWMFVNSVLDRTGRNFDLTWDYPAWPNWTEFSPFTGCDEPLSYMTAAYHFAEGQISISDGKRVFDFDEQAVDLHPKDALNRADAIATILRFYESQGAVASEAEAQQILDAADKRRNEILTSETTVTCSGTAYYVSTDGDDNNDGKTPETAWKSIDRVNSTKLKAGDAVYFRRGDLWRDELLNCAEGVTYSAYGTGEKPKFIGSPESGVGEEKWSLYYEGDNKEKIWQFHRDMPDTGGVIFNAGESWADRIYGWWSVDGYVQYDATDLAFTPEACLTQNLTFCSMPDFTGCEYPFGRYEYNKQGPLYLRCDEGNPGLLYSAIEFETTDREGWAAIIYCAEGCTIDNLSILYWGNTAIAADNRTPSITVQNCEIGWGGNCIHMYIQEEPTKEYMLSGDGIYGICDKGLVENNYCHDVDGNGITFESDEVDETVMTGDYRCAGNLIEHCGQGIWLHDDFQTMTLTNLLIEDNLILYTGYGYCHGCWCPEISIAVDDLASRAESVTIRNNTGYLAMDGLLHISGLGEMVENNSFYQK